MTWLSRYQILDQGKVYGYRVVDVLAEPVTLAEAWSHLRIDVAGSPPAGPDDDWITDIGIPAARDWCESYLGTAIAAQTIEVATNSFPYGAIPLAFGPVTAIDVVEYDDDLGTQTVASGDYVLNVYTIPNQVGTAIGISWPAAVNYANSVRVRYFAGYGVFGSPIDDVPLPPAIRAAVLLTLGHLYENREATIVGVNGVTEILPMGAQSLLQRYVQRTSIA